MAEQMNQKAQSINMILAFLTLVCVIAIIAVIGFFTLEKGPEIIQGQAEVTTYRVSSKIPERIKEYRVEEGDYVHFGDTLVILEAPDILAKKAQAEAAKAAATAQSDKAQKGARSEQIRGAYEMWQKSKAGLEIMRKSYTRIENLYNEGVVPAQKRDEVLAQYKAAQATERAARSQYDLALAGAQEEDKQAAAALVERAEGAIAEVNAYINESVLLASADGVVDEIYPHVGELVGSGGPIMSIARTDEMWVSFNVREDLLSEMSVGTEFDAKVPALGNKEYRFKIYHMKDLGSYAAWKATKPSGMYDMRTFEVRARPLSQIEGLKAGMSVIYEKEVK